MEPAYYWVGIVGLPSSVDCFAKESKNLPHDGAAPKSGVRLRRVSGPSRASRWAGVGSLSKQQSWRVVLDLVVVQTLSNHATSREMEVEKRLPHHTLPQNPLLPKFHPRGPRPSLPFRRDESSLVPVVTWCATTPACSSIQGDKVNGTDPCDSAKLELVTRKWEDPLTGALQSSPGASSAVGRYCQVNQRWLDTVPGSERPALILVVSARHLERYGLVNP
eukprot:scaffold965_cov158-Amphora_coffeaeformis.AAC.18